MQGIDFPTYRLLTLDLSKRVSFSAAIRKVYVRQNNTFGIISDFDVGYSFSHIQTELFLQENHNKNINKNKFYGIVYRQNIYYDKNKDKIKLTSS